MCSRQFAAHGLSVGFGPNSEAGAGLRARVAPMEVIYTTKIIFVV
jgi:hypothetical protein